MPALTALETKQVERGRLVLREAVDELAMGSGAFTGVLLVESEERHVWDAILDFQSLPERTPMLQKVDIYRDEEQAGGQRAISVAYEMQVVSRTVRYALAHTLSPDDRHLAWSLDAQRKQDFEDLEGSFTVFPREKGCLLLYTTRVRTGIPMPDWVQDLLTKRALRGFLRSIKSEAQRRSEAASRSAKPAAR